MAEGFAGLLRAQEGLDAEAPYNGAVYDLLNETWQYTGSRTKVFRRTVKAPADKKAPETEAYAPSSAYAALEAAVQRLTELTRGMKQWANRDIRRITTQIESVCKKIKADRP